MEIVFQSGATSSNNESMKVQFYVYTSQSISSLKLKETLRADRTKDLRKEACCRKPHEKLLNRLRDHGNNKIMIHEVFIRKIVEKYGTINATLSKKEISKCTDLRNQRI